MTTNKSTPVPFDLAKLPRLQDDPDYSRAYSLQMQAQELHDTSESEINEILRQLNQAGKRDEAAPADVAERFLSGGKAPIGDLQTRLGQAREARTRAMRANEAATVAVNEAVGKFQNRLAQAVYPVIFERMRATVADLQSLRDRLEQEGQSYEEMVRHAGHSPVGFARQFSCQTGWVDYLLNDTRSDMAQIERELGVQKPSVLSRLVESVKPRRPAPVDAWTPEA